MTDKKNAKSEEKKLHRHVNPVIHVESDESPSGPMIESEDDSTVFHPGHHRGGGVIGAVPEVPNLSPGGSVTIKR